MSRDFTPRELLLAEKTLPEGKTWRDMGKSLVFVRPDGTKEPMYNSKTDDFIYQFDYIGRIGFEMARTFIRMMGGLDGNEEFIKNAFEYVENRLVCLINTDTCDDEYLEKWFNGKLDPGYYYSEENNYVFASYLMQIMEE